MERTLWTDERLDDAIARIDARFDQLERRMDRVEDEIARLRAQMMNGFIAIMLAHAGTITAVLVAH